MEHTRTAPSPCDRLGRTLLPVVVIALCALGLGLRLYRLGDADVWWDEGWSIWLARMSLPGLAERTAYDTNPPLYYAVLHFWRALAGESEFALRLLSVFGGVAAVAAVHRLAREFGRPGAGPVAAALMAASPFMVLWSQQARMYSWATALGLLSTALALRLWRERRGGAGYVLVTVALLHTHTLGLLYPALQNLMWLPRRPAPRRWLLSQVALAGALAPWAIVFLSRTPTWSVHDSVDLPTYLAYYWSALLRGTSVHLEQHGPELTVGAALFVLCLLPAVRELGRTGRVALGQMVIAALAPPLAVFALSQPRSFLYTPRPEVRYLNPFAPLVYLLWAAGAGAAWRMRRLLGAGLLAGAVILLMATLPAYYRERVPTDEYRSLAVTLATYAQPDDLVLLHTDSDWPVFVYQHPGPWQGVPNSVAWEETSAAGFLGQFLPEREVSWLVVTPDALRADPAQAVRGELERWCAEGDCHVDRWRFDARELIRFGRGAPLPAPSLPAALAAAGGFDGLWWPYTHARAHSLWRVYGWWSGGEPYPALRLASPAGGEPAPVEPIAEGDAAPVGPVRLEYRFRLDRAGAYRLLTASGELLVGLTVSDVGTDATLEVGTPQAVEVTFGDALILEAAAIGGATVAPGDRLCVSLDWRAVRPVDAGYTVFVHLVGETYNAAQGNFLWGQHDGLPADGARPTTSWGEGEVIVDGHCFVVRPDAPPGEYILEAGLYDALSGARLPVTAGGEGDRAIVGRVTVPGRAGR